MDCWNAPDEHYCNMCPEVIMPIVSLLYINAIYFSLARINNNHNYTSLTKNHLRWWLTFSLTQTHHQVQNVIFVGRMIDYTSIPVSFRDKLQFHQMITFWGGRQSLSMPSRSILRGVPWLLHLLQTASWNYWCLNMYIMNTSEHHTKQMTFWTSIYSLESYLHPFWTIALMICFVQTLYFDWIRKAYFHWQDCC